MAERQLSERDWLAAILFGEMAGRPENEMRVVADTIANRVNAPDNSTYGNPLRGSRNSFEGQIHAYTGNNPQFSAIDEGVATRESARGIPYAYRNFTTARDNPASLIGNREYEKALRVADSFANQNSSEYNRYRGIARGADYYDVLPRGSSWASRQSWGKANTFDIGPQHLYSRTALGPEWSDPGPRGSGVGFDPSADYNAWVQNSDLSQTLANLGLGDPSSTFRDQYRLTDIPHLNGTDFGGNVSGNVAAYGLLDAYRDYLGRDPDAGGWQAALNTLNNGASLQNVRDSIANSSEAQARYSALSNRLGNGDADLVRALADPLGSTNVSSGVGPQGFQDTYAPLTQLAQDYRTYLGRDLGREEAGAWLDQLGQGRGFQAIERDIARSPEALSYASTIGVDPNEWIRGLGPDTTAAPVGPGSIGTVPPTSIGTVGPGTINPLDPLGIGTVGPTGIGTVDPSYLSPLGPSSISTVGPDTIGMVGPSYLNPLSPESISTVQPDYASTVGGPPSLSPIGPESINTVGPQLAQPVGPETASTVGPTLADFRFDPQVYAALNPDVVANGLDPYTHFTQYGMAEGRQVAPGVSVPQGVFDSAGYLRQNPDIAASGLDPFMHYLRYGQAEGRLGAQFIGPDMPAVASLANPSGGSAANAGPQAFAGNFNPSAYLAANPDIATNGMNPMEHYLRYGYNEGRALNLAGDRVASGFDAASYLSQNPDIAAARIDPLQHYLTSGASEGRLGVQFDMTGPYGFGTFGLGGPQAFTGPAPAAAPSAPINPYSFTGMNAGSVAEPGAFSDYAPPPSYYSPSDFYGAPAPQAAPAPAPSAARYSPNEIVGDAGVDWSIPSPPTPAPGTYDASSPGMSPSQAGHNAFMASQRQNTQTLQNNARTNDALYAQTVTPVLAPRPINAAPQPSYASGSPYGSVSLFPTII